MGQRSELFDLVCRNYFVALQLDDRERAPVVGWRAHPSWVFRPRREALTGDTAAVERRYLIERGLAEAKMRQTQAGTLPFRLHDDIEAAAAAVVAAAQALERGGAAK